MTKEEKQARIYASRQATWQRAEKYYPSDQLKQDLNEYALQTGEYKSELAIRLLKSFFAARKNGEGCPGETTILP